MALTKMQRAFIVAYCENPKLGQADAARKAGCSIKRAKTTAYEWMRDPDVKLEIERQLAAKLGQIETRAKTGEVNRESLCQQCDDIIEECTRQGAGAWQMQSRLKAIELKAKLYGLLTEKVEVGMDEKLIELLEAGRKRAGLPNAGPAPFVPATVVLEAPAGELNAGN